MTPTVSANPDCNSLQWWYSRDTFSGIACICLWSLLVILFLSKRWSTGCSLGQCWPSSRKSESQWSICSDRGKYKLTPAFLTPFTGISWNFCNMPYMIWFQFSTAYQCRYLQTSIPISVGDNLFKCLFIIAPSYILKCESHNWRALSSSQPGPRARGRTQQSALQQL